MYQTILVPLDGSKRAERILPYIEELARYFAARILLTQVIEPHIEFSGSSVADQDEAVEEFKLQTQQAEDYLSTIEERLEANGLQVQKQVFFGDVVKSIIMAAQGVKADMIAIASHGLTGLSQVFYGSVTAGVLHQVDRPLLIIRADSEEEIAEKEAYMYTRILVPLDGSKRAERILPFVEKLALGFNSEVIFLQVVQTDFAYISSYSYYTDAGLEKAEREKIRGEAEAYLGGQQGEFREKGIQARSLVTEGPVVRTIINVAEREGADLIAMASHGRTGLTRVFYGSVAAGVLHQVDRPLLIIRSEGEG
jgi:nucleotide-binding universal stress UspA family protein